MGFDARTVMVRSVSFVQAGFERETYRKSYTEKAFDHSLRGHF